MHPPKKLFEENCNSLPSKQHSIMLNYFSLGLAWGSDDQSGNQMSYSNHQWMPLTVKPDNDQCVLQQVASTQSIIQLPTTCNDFISYNAGEHSFSTTHSEYQDDSKRWTAAGVLLSLWAIFLGKWPKKNTKPKIKMLMQLNSYFHNRSIKFENYENGAVHFSTRNSQCNNFLNISLIGIFSHGKVHMIVD